RHAAPCEGAGARDRAELRLSMGGHLGHRTTRAGSSRDFYSPIAHDQIIGRRLDHLRGDFQQFVAHLLRRREAGGAKRNGGTAATRILSIRSSIGPSTSPSNTWPVAPRSPLPSTLRRRKARGSMPILAAISSVCRSSAKVL